MGIDQLRVIDTGLDPVTAEREQWDDGNNTLALAPKVAVAYERNVETNERLAEAGIEVIAIAGLGAGLGPGRSAVHVLPDRPGLTGGNPRCETPCWHGSIRNRRDNSFVLGHHGLRGFCPVRYFEGES